jgi:uncharacterized DUF497 family protein
MADFEWDLRKEAENVAKHEIDFTTASLIWNAPVYEQLDNRRDYGEMEIYRYRRSGESHSHGCFYMAARSGSDHFRKDCQTPREKAL